MKNKKLSIENHQKIEKQIITLKTLCIILRSLYSTDFFNLIHCFL